MQDILLVRPLSPAILAPHWALRFTTLGLALEYLNVLTSSRRLTFTGGMSTLTPLIVSLLGLIQHGLRLSMPQEFLIPLGTFQAKIAQILAKYEAP